LRGKKKKKKDGCLTARDASGKGKKRFKSNDWQWKEFMLYQQGKGKGEEDHV